jgi:hypothetical protein
LYQDARAARVTSENKNIKGSGNIPRIPRKVEFVKPNEKKTVTAGLKFPLHVFVSLFKQLFSKMPLFRLGW